MITRPIYRVSRWSDEEPSADERQDTEQEDAWPALKIEIGGTLEQDLDDIGTQASAVDRMKLREMQVRLHIPESLVAGLNIQGTFGARNRVRTLAIIALQVQEVMLPMPCSVVIRMSTDIILGVDFFVVYEG